MKRNQPSQRRSRRCIVWGCRVGVLAVLAVGFVGCPPPTPPPPDDGGTIPNAVAAGLNLELVDVNIPLDRKPEVRFTATDNKGRTIPIDEFTDARFILGYLMDPAPGDTANYVSYTTRTEDPDRTPGTGDEAVQATYDSAALNGLTQASNGVYTYKFATALPGDYPRDATHQIAGQFRRTNVVDGLSYVANLAEPFRPDGAAVTDTREIVDSETCNSCHTRLSIHGDVRREIQLCIMCHTPQSTDANSGNSVSMAEMVHKIHMGERLPSVEEGHPYQIIGFGNSVHDYSTVVYPQDVRNCVSCHSNAPQAEVWKTKPTLEGCASCHDRTWFGAIDETPAGFANHVGGMQVDNSLCSLCHTPTAPGPSPIMEAHVLPTQSASAPGLALDITNVTTTAVEGGFQLTIQFVAVDKNNAPISAFDSTFSVSSVVAWPAPEYQTYRRETMTGSSPPGTLVNNGGGSYSYTFGQVFPNDAGSYAVAMEGRRAFTFRGTNMQQGTASNGHTFFALDGSTPDIRRSVIEEEKCNACHREIRFHGEQRVGVDLCLMCHNPNTTDEARRPGDAMPPATVNFKDMLHRIHTGEDLDEPYTVYGFGNVAHDFTHVRFPGIRQDCAICHVDGSVDLPLPDEAVSTMITQGGEFVSEILPERAACTSCHDNVVSGVHALLNTQNGVESCAVCHGPNGSFSVDSAHALTP